VVRTFHPASLNLRLDAGIREAPRPVALATADFSV
jgi:hypothetical protein